MGKSTAPNSAKQPVHPIRLSLKAPYPVQTIAPGRMVVPQNGHSSISGPGSPMVRKNSNSHLRSHRCTVLIHEHKHMD